MQRRVINEKAMFVLAVLAEPFPVVAHQRYQHAVVGAPLAQVIKEAL
jgi:hypothetical protein